MTVGAALASAAALLGMRLDAELLLGHVLDASRAALIAHDDRVLTPEEQGDFERLVARRRAGEPLAYLTGTRGFWSLTLEVTPAVLIPRPETELLVEWTLSVLRTADARIFDLGTGSGAIALALARERPQARVLASDLSAAALAVAAANARRLGLTQVEFVEGPDYAPLAARPRGSDAGFDVIVSNPPYIAAGDPHLPALRHEPQSALVAGADGLADLRRIVAGAPAHLARGGWLLVEHGADQGAAVRELFAAAAFADVETRRDLAGHERATGGRHV